MRRDAAGGIPLDAVQTYTAISSRLIFVSVSVSPSYVGTVSRYKKKTKRNANLCLHFQRVFVAQVNRCSWYCIQSNDFQRPETAWYCAICSQMIKASRRPLAFSTESIIEIRRRFTSEPFSVIIGRTDGDILAVFSVPTNHRIRISCIVIWIW